MKKIKLYIIKKLLDSLSDFSDTEQAEQSLANACRYFFNNDPGADITIKNTVFNTKYESDMRGKYDVPSTFVRDFYESADRGDKSFMHHYFYRVLRRNNDRVVRSLKHRLKRNVRA